MAGVLDEGFASLAEDLETHLGELVTYTVAVIGTTIVVAGAIRQRNTHERLAIAEGRIAWEEEPQDWCVRPGAIDYGAGPHEPVQGDRITDGQARVYEVLPRSDEPAVRLSDPYGHLLRIRTVRVA